MTRDWAQKQLLERAMDVCQINKLSDKKIDFGVITDEDRSVTFHVFFKLNKVRDINGL
jgi:hypothetical protein